jgi:hypothetical protein
VKPGTFSIAAADPSTGEVGVAGQSRYSRSATSSRGQRPEWGHRHPSGRRGRLPPRGLDELEVGAGAADGRAAAFTRERCQPWAGHVVGDGFAAQGNILAGEEVVLKMARARSRRRAVRWRSGSWPRLKRGSRGR